jgi:hypothetical protein
LKQNILEVNYVGANEDCTVHRDDRNVGHNFRHTWEFGRPKGGRSEAAG